MSRQKTQFRPLPVPNVTVHGLFGERQEAICAYTAGALLERCIDAGMLEQIDCDRPSPGSLVELKDSTGRPQQINDPLHKDFVSAQMFWDSDFGKSIETVAYALYRRPNPELEARVDAIIDLYGKLQRPDGYVNSWFQRIAPGREWCNMRDTHELYCAGHLIEGAVAYYQATGKRKLLDIMCRYADYLAKRFGRGEGQVRGYCGHEEIELALVKLARVTGEHRYLDLAKFFIDERGQSPHFFDEEAKKDERDPAKFFFHSYEYNQSHLPVRAQRKVVGHAVRAMYLYSGMADIATEYHDDSLTEALEILWDDLTSKQMYITGGIGPSAENEGFTDYFDLPNESAYAETCASIGLIFWAARMLGRGPNRRYGDIMEQALYNGAMSGLSLDGKKFFYDNPLESSGKHHRWIWHRCPCCPPNIARLLASIGSYMYCVAEDAVAVHLYGESTAHFDIAGTKVTLSQTTRYPWDGAIHLDITPEVPAHFVLSLRIPEWAEKGGQKKGTTGQAVTLRINGEMVDLNCHMVDGYARLERLWQPSDVIDLLLPLGLRPQYANPKIRQDVGRVALMRGPLVYCAEAVDNDADLNSFIVPEKIREAKLTALEDLGHAVALDIEVTREESANWGQSLYRDRKAARSPANLRLIPYHLWDNRDPGAMLVWFQSD